jgi:hypothetical protein
MSRSTPTEEAPRNESFAQSIRYVEPADDADDTLGDVLDDPIVVESHASDDGETATVAVEYGDVTLAVSAPRSLDFGELEDAVAEAFLGVREYAHALDVDDGGERA